MQIAIVGEALIDFTSTGAGLHFNGREGGAPANVAIAAARLGVPAGFIGQLSNDLFGQRLWAHLERNGVDLCFVTRSDAPSTLAFVERTPTTNAYAFYTNGTADTRWSPERLPQLPECCRFLQFGSIALLHEPAASRIVDLVAAERARGRIVLFDPNVRPSLIADLSDYRKRFGHWVQQADLLKLSDEDASLIAPDKSAADFAQGLLERGLRAVVLTRGAQGASLFRQDAPRVDVRAPAQPVLDTIGAGDTFAAGLAVALLEQGVQRAAQLVELAPAAWQHVLHFAAMAAALNCTRAGADPPKRAELDQALAHSNHPTGGPAPLKQ